MPRRTLSFLAAITTLAAHPMGNFSVSHYTRIGVGAKSVNVIYVLDLAEIPTYQLLRNWGLDPAADAKISQAVLDEKAASQANEWMKALDFQVGGRRLHPKLDHASVKLSDGAGGMRVARIESRMTIDSGVTGELDFEDHNYPDRAGWKEIVIVSTDGSPILQASQGSEDKSKSLTQYPSDPTLAPPQDLRASVEWRTALLQQAPQVTKVAPTSPKITPIPQPAPPVTQGSTPMPSTNAKPVPGEVTRGDFLSRLLSKREIPFSLMLLGVCVAFGLGALHATSPGHGKTIVAAYLVGSRGTMKHAAFLGAMVTFTHTISVFALGIVTLVFSNVIAPEKLTTWLGVISGLSIVVIGASLFWKRLRALRKAQAMEHAHDHHHEHAHVHDHEHVHAHAHSHDHHHHHSHDHDHHHDHVHAHHHHDHDHAHGHDHGPHSHSHVPEGEITLGSLIALGASGGLVPCPSALVLLLVSISLGHVGLGLVLLTAFSLGLAGVLMAIGMLVIYAKHLLPDPVNTARHPAFRLVPVFSAFVIMCVGLLMTGVSLGWVKPSSFAG